MSPEQQRRLGRWARGVVLTVPLLISGWWLWCRQPQPSVAFDDALDRALAPVLEQTGAQSKLGVPTTQHLKVLSRDLARRSVAFLEARDLELWAETRWRAARASKAACTDMWKGRDGHQLAQALVLLGPDSLEAYAQMLARALALRLERKAPPQVASRALERGLSAIAQQLPAAEQANFELDAQRPDVSDERACQLFLVVSEHAAKLDPLLRAEFYRALASALEAQP